MIFAAVMSVLLILALLAFSLTGMGRMIPSGVRLVPLIELALLWLYTFWLKGKGWPSTLFLVQFWIVFALLVLPAGALWVIESFDRERASAPVVLGDQEADREIAIVYHPGASSFTTDTLHKLGARLVGAGYKVVLYTACKGLDLDTSRPAALGLSSPVYGGQIRPPLERFISAHDLTGVRCFVALTGGGSSDNDETELNKAASLVEESGGGVIAQTKIPQNGGADEIGARLDAFAAGILGALGG